MSYIVSPAKLIRFSNIISSHLKSEIVTVTKAWYRPSARAVSSDSVMAATEKFFCRKSVPNQDYFVGRVASVVREGTKFMWFNLYSSIDMC